jgi:hypothetical protein
MSGGATTAQLAARRGGREDEARHGGTLAGHRRHRDSTPDGQLRARHGVLDDDRERRRARRQRQRERDARRPPHSVSPSGARPCTLASPSSTSTASHPRAPAPPPPRAPRAPRPRRGSRHGEQDDEATHKRSGARSTARPGTPTPPAAGAHPQRGRKYQSPSTPRWPAAPLPRPLSLRSAGVAVVPVDRSTPGSRPRVRDTRRNPKRASSSPLPSVSCAPRAVVGEHRAHARSPYSAKLPSQRPRQPEQVHPAAHGRIDHGEREHLGP